MPGKQKDMATDYDPPTRYDDNDEEEQSDNAAMAMLEKEMGIGSLGKLMKESVAEIQEELEKLKASEGSI